MARAAYLTFREDAIKALNPRPGFSQNAAVEIESWDTVKSSVDEASSTFKVNLYKIDSIPFTFPSTGSGYQVIDGKWERADSAQFTRDYDTNTAITAPTQMQGWRIISYKFSAWRWIKAWLRWTIELMLRLVVVLALMAMFVAFLYYFPWTRGWQIISNAIRYILQSSQANSAGYQYPTATPTPTRVIHTTSRIEVGK